MPLPAAELVTAVMARLAVTTPTELAKALELRDYAAPRRIKRWLDGDNDPDYEATMLMLEAVGWSADQIDGARRKARRRPTGWAAVNDHLEEALRLLEKGEPLDPGEAQAAAELADRLSRLAALTSQVADQLASVLDERRARRP